MTVILLLGLGGCGGSSGTTSVPVTSAKNRINSHAIVFTEMAEATKDALTEAASTSHSGMIRMDLTWASLQPSAPPAPYDWHWADESIRSAKKNNLGILALIAETPAWASSHPNDPSFRSYPPAADHWDEWEAFITAFVDRYGVKGTNEIRHWEIWGEANDDGQWLGTPAEYAQLYARAYNAIKRSDPGAEVLMAGLNESKMPDWLDAVLNDPTYPARDKIDIIDVHIRGSFDHVKELAAGAKELFRLQGVKDKAIWVTEFGFPSSPAFQNRPEWDPHFAGLNASDGEQKQADYYDTVIPWLLTEGGIDKLFVTLRDLDTPNLPWESEGIMTQAGTPKIAFGTIKTLSDRFQ